MTWQDDLASATMAASRLGFQASWTRSGTDQDLIAGCDTLCRKSHSQRARRKVFRTERPFRSMLSHDPAAAPASAMHACQRDGRGGASTNTGTLLAWRSRSRLLGLEVAHE